jgi:hypothetical protein
MAHEKFVVVRQRPKNPEFKAISVYKETKELILEMEEMTGVNKVNLIHQMVLYCMNNLEVKDSEE